MRWRIGSAVGAVLAIGIAFGAGAIWGGSGSSAPSVMQPDDIDAAAEADAPVAAAEAAVADAQRDYDQAMADLDSPNPSSSYVPDPQIQQGERHAIELNEMICKETGQNCEFARMARRQYQEKYGAR